MSPNEWLSLRYTSLVFLEGVEDFDGRTQLRSAMERSCRASLGFSEQSKNVAASRSFVDSVAPRKSGSFRSVYTVITFSTIKKGKFERIIKALKTEGTFVDTDTCINMIGGERRSAWRAIFRVGRPLETLA